MALPKLNDSPKYELVIPSTQKAVRFRPYLVKEEKVLMMAMESQDEAQVLGAITDTIAACVDDNIKISKLTTFDVEYMFIQIRAKSVGESIELNMACKECEHQTAVSVKLDDVKIDVPKVSNMIELSDQISIEMRWPTYTAMLDSSVFNFGFGFLYMIIPFYISSNGQRALTLIANGSCKPCSNRLHPANAIIAPLSVQNSWRG